MQKGSRTMSPIHFLIKFMTVDPTGPCATQQRPRIERFDANEVGALMELAGIKQKIVQGETILKNNIRAQLLFNHHISYCN